MNLLSLILGQFVSVGVIMLIIIFQPEVRRFLLMIGRSTVRRRPNFLQRILSENVEADSKDVANVLAIKQALLRMSRLRTGAIIVLSGNMPLGGVFENSTVIDARIEQELIESVFKKSSPLHDGAMIISDDRIAAVGCILPITQKRSLPSNAGLRHRAAVGVTEQMEVSAFVVSEETGQISYSQEGNLEMDISEERIYDLLEKEFIGSNPGKKNKEVPPLKD